MTPETTDKLLQASEKLIDRLTEIGQQYGPQAAELALNVYRIEAINNLLVGGFLLLLTIAFVAGTAWASIKVARLVRDEDEGPMILFVPIVLVGGVPSVLFFFDAVSRLLDIYNWIGLWHPEVLMARQVLGL